MRRRGRAGRRLAGWALAAVLCGALGGCAGSTTALSPSSARERAAEIEQLQQRVLELQRRLSVAEVELDRLRREVGRLESGEPAGRRAPGNRPGRSGGDRRSAEAGERVAPSTFEVEELEDDVPSPPASPPAAVEEPIAAERPDPANAAVEPPAPSPPADGTAAAEITEEAQELYDRGYTLFHQGRYLDAEATFQRFLQRHRGTELADNAQYWIGEARFARGDLDGALAAFRETASRFPEGNKVPDALLKAGEVEAARGNGEQARTIYLGVIERFPGTAAAAVAEDRLAALR